jgi:hypothetical protein
VKNLKLAFKKLSLRVVLLQWFGNLGVALLAFMWLQIPDSHAWQFVFSIISGAVIVFAILWLYAHTFRILLRPEAVAPLWQRLFVLLVVIVLGYFLLQGIDILRSHETLWAGYWNSKVSPNMRTFFTFQRLVKWQQILYDLIQWLVAALLLPIAVVGAGKGLGRGGFRHVRNIYCHFSYWLVTVLAAFAGSYLTSALVSWTPGHGFAGEMISVLARFGVAYTLDILLWCWVLAFTTACVLRQKPAEPPPAQ